jgi:hypothetical protein
MMRKTFSYLHNRFLEASTWAGLGLAFTAGAAFYKELIIGAVLCGAFAVLMPDYAPKP